MTRISVVQICGLWHVQENGVTMMDAVYTHEVNARAEARAVIKLRILAMGVHS